MSGGAVVVVGGTGGIGREIARHYLSAGSDIVVTGRDQGRVDNVDGELDSGTRGLAFDLAMPETIAGALSEVGPVSRLIVAAIALDNNPVREYKIDAAT